MSKRKGSATAASRFVEFDEALQSLAPQLNGFLADEEGFRGLHIKRQQDGTFLAVAKGFGPDGGEVVCFGSGYGAVGCLLTLEAAIAGNNWRVDKPWAGK